MSEFDDALFRTALQTEYVAGQVSERRRESRGVVSKADVLAVLVGFSLWPIGIVVWWWLF